MVVKRVEERSKANFIIFLIGEGYRCWNRIFPDAVKGGIGFVYMALCGLVAAEVRKPPGLSGSYILLLWAYAW